MSVCSDRDVVARVIVFVDEEDRTQHNTHTTQTHKHTEKYVREEKKERSMYHHCL